MKITVLIDNLPNPTLNLKHEHGLCIYIEVDGYKWLLDVGASEQFAFNAEKLGIDIADVDFLILSHGHRDHAGGLAQFLRMNRKAIIYISSDIEDKLFFSYRHNPKRDISINHFLVRNHIERFVVSDSDIRISESVAFIRNIPIIHPTPLANCTLFQANDLIEFPDNFDHESVLAVLRPNGIVAFSGCSHKGILNMLDACSSYFNSAPVIVCIGGTHLLDSDSNNQYETNDQIHQIALDIALNHPKMQLITGHCTGNNAKQIFADTLNHRFHTFYSGYQMEL